MQIRPEVPDDVAAISAVITKAFLEAEHSGGNEADIVNALRRDGSLSVSLVAIENGMVVGLIAFSPITIDGRNDGWFGLGPVAVVPDRQGDGIGSALISAGLGRLEEQGFSGCVVLGDPAYYARFGFSPDPNLRLAGVPPEYFQRLSFGKQSCTGTVNYHEAFGAG